ncbi:hypothetical protein QZH41_013421 [Actinostola sp. cb2023]|nr:hypothetical protein QZH41_013421 [Actinostola sp. cb2023]
MAKTYDFLFKLLLIGDSGVGKTCVLFRFSEDAFNATFISTIGGYCSHDLCRSEIPASFNFKESRPTFSSRWLIILCFSGIDFKIRTIELDGKKIKLQIWDTAGQERFRTITTAYYRGAMGIMLVYDITNDKSFENIKNWIRNIEEHASQDVEKMVLGNKCDMDDRRQVSKDRGEQVSGTILVYFTNYTYCTVYHIHLAVEYGIKFMETSAKASINVEEAFFTLARDIKLKMDKKLVSLNY